MPVIDGYEAAQRLRDRGRFSGLRRTPVVALTAYPISGDVERSMALAKPYTTDQLRASLHLGLMTKPDESAPANCVAPSISMTRELQIVVCIRALGSEA